MATANKKSAKQADDVLTIENVGAIKSVSVKVPKTGGLIVFRGRNGAGKTTAINAVEAAIGSGPRLRKRDGALGSGSIETPWGVSIRIGQSARKSGELEVAVLDDEFSIVDLVDPKEKDPAAADRRSIKALLRVSGAKADFDTFAPLFDSEEEFREMVDVESIKTDDPVQMAGTVKRNIEGICRLYEKRQESVDAKLLAISESLSGVDFSHQFDLENIKASHTEAVKALAYDEQSRAKYLYALEKIQQIDSAIVTAGPAAICERIETAEALKAESNRSVEASQQSIEKIDVELKALNEKRAELLHRLELDNERASRASAELESARALEESVEAMTVQREEFAAVPPVSEEDIERSKSEVERLRLLMTEAEIVERNRSKLADKEALSDELSRLMKKTEKLRASAKGTEGILSEMVSRLGTPLSVVFDDNGNTRLAVDHPERGQIYFSELSKGEKLAIVTRIAINAVGDTGVFTVPQEFYEGLDPENREIIVRELVESGVLGVTAECDSGPLRATVLS